MNTEEKILRTFKLIKNAFPNEKSITFPQDTEFSKTYAYRHIQRFVKELQKSKINEEYIPDVISYIVKSAQRNKNLCRGLSIFNGVDVLDIYQNVLEQRISTSDKVLNEIKKTHSFFNSNRQHLLDKERAGGFTNFTKWYKDNKISIYYIAVSKVCRRAMCKLDEEERAYFPKVVELLKLRLKILSDNEIQIALSEILGPDLFKE